MSQSVGDRQAQMMLYQITVSDLSYFKSQQWAVANHAFLLLAAIVAVRQLVGSLSLLETVSLVVLAVGVVVASLVLLFKLQHSIVVRQSRLDAAREKLGLEFYTTWAAKDKGTEYIHAIWILRSAVVVGGLVVCWLLLRPAAG